MFPPNQYSQIVGLRNPCDAPIEQAAVPSFATSISLVSSLLSQETLKVLLGLEQYRESGKWPENSGQPLSSVLFIDMKNNRFTQMELKRGEKCYVCGKEGTAKDIATRNELPILDLSRNSDKALRDATKSRDESLMIFAENSAGEKKLEANVKSERGLRAGDYLRVLSENKNGSIRESILRLT
jgi:hypothetical protein